MLRWLLRDFKCSPSNLTDVRLLIFNSLHPNVNLIDRQSIGVYLRRMNIYSWLLLIFVFSLPAEAKTPLEIPFNYHKHQILVDATIAGQGPYLFILDTGVTPSAIDTELVKRLGLPLDEQNASQANGGGKDTVYIYPSSIQSLQLQGRDFGDINAVAFPTGGISSKLGLDLHGILGNSFLNNKTVQIDYARQSIQFDPQLPDIGENTYVFDLVTAPDDIMPLMQVELNGEILIVSMDTGSSFGLELFSNGVEKIGGIPEDIEWQETTAAGARGEFTIRDGVWPMLKIGPFELFDIQASIPDRDGGRYKHANAGNALFERFKITFDYQGGKVFLEDNHR